jgi:competence protein ComEA
MRLLVLFVALTTLVFESCTSRETATTSRAAISGSHVEKASGTEPKPQQPCLNLNIATADELIKLPGVGEVMAKRIIDYRERHGPLRRPEEIIIIEGFSERKYRAIAALVCVD